MEYEEILKGINGKILTTTDARGKEGCGRDLKVSLDVNIQAYCQQAAEKAMAEKQADSVSILLMNPQNGEIYACVNVPEFDLNDPFTLQQDTTGLSAEIQEKINFDMPGLSEGVVSPNDSFFCPGYKIVEDRRIHCHKRTGQNFVQGARNSCNPVFIEVGLRLGVEKFCDYFRNFGLMEKTGIDLPGEASTIMHKEENIGEVELATIFPFGIRLALRAALVRWKNDAHVSAKSHVVKGGKRRGSFGRNFQDGARNSGKRRFRRVWKNAGTHRRWAA